jgi:phosphotriesterase-related protein
MSVVTVLGEIEESELGITLPHEHILIDLRNQYTEPSDPDIRRLGLRSVSEETAYLVRRDPYALRDNLLLDDVECAVKEIERFKNIGGRTIVDCTNRGLYPRPKDLAEISRRTGVNIIAGCGYYTEDTHPQDMGERSVEEIANEMIHDLTEGIGDTNIRAGIIGEIGTSRMILPNEVKVLQATARAYKQVQKAIYVHTYPWSTEGIVAAQYLIDGNVDPSQIVICHIDASFDLEYLRELLKMDVCVEFDNFGKEFEPDASDESFAGGRFASDKDRIRVIKKCIDWGYISQILITNDICLKCMLHKYGGAGYSHIQDNVVPTMRDQGITEFDINQLLIENPRFLLNVA